MLVFFAAGPFLWLRRVGFSLRWLLLLRSAGARAHGLSGCGCRAPEHRLSVCAHGLVAPQHVGSSWIKNWTHISCIGRWIPNHWATREVPSIFHFEKKKPHKLASENPTTQWKLHANFKSVCVIHVCFMYILTDGIFIIYANTAHKALLQVFKWHIVYLL